MYLQRQGCCFAAAPNRRTAVEYAVCLVWLADQTDQVVDILNRRLQQDQIQLANRLRDARLTERFPPDAYQVLVDTVVTELSPERDERLLHIGPLLDECGYDALKAYYKVESRFVHPSLTAIQEFAHDGEEGLIFRQRPLHEELVPCQQFCLMVLFDARLAFNTLLVGSPWTDVLMEVAADHGCQRICPCATFAPDTGNPPPPDPWLVLYVHEVLPSAVCAAQVRGRV